MSDTAPKITKCNMAYDIVEGKGIDPHSFVLSMDGKLIGKLGNFELKVSADQDKCMMYIKGPDVGDANTLGAAYLHGHIKDRSMSELKPAEMEAPCDKQ
jgi:hypothetical protein